jgi:hypothetical protein
VNLLALQDVQGGIQAGKVIARHHAHNGQADG